VVIDGCSFVGVENKLVYSRLLQKRPNLGLENSQWLIAVLDFNKYLLMLHSISIGPEDISPNEKLKIKKRLNTANKKLRASRRHK
jgi:hypothetical protein